MIGKIRSLTDFVSPGGGGYGITLRVGRIVHLIMHCIT